MTVKLPTDLTLDKVDDVSFVTAALAEINSLYTTDGPS